MKKLNLTEATVLALEGKLNEVDIESELEKYQNKGFDWPQLEEIREGLEAGLDVSIYANPEYDNHQMYQIRMGLEEGLDVSIYADLKFNYKQMRQILYGLQDGLDVSEYADPKYDADDMKYIRKEMKSELEDHKTYQNLSDDEKKQTVEVYTGYNGYKKGFIVDSIDAKEYGGMETTLYKIKLLNGKTIWARWNDSANDYYSVDRDNYKT